MSTQFDENNLISVIKSCKIMVSNLSKDHREYVC